MVQQEPEVRPEVGCVARDVGAAGVEHDFYFCLTGDSALFTSSNFLNRTES